MQRGYCCLQADSKSQYRTVNLKNAALSATALKAVLAFMYTERLDVAIEDVDAVLRVAKKCKMHAVVKAIGDEMRTLKYYFKSTRRDEAPRRLYQALSGAKKPAIATQLHLVSWFLYHDASSMVHVLLWRGYTFSGTQVTHQSPHCSLLESELTLSSSVAYGADKAAHQRLCDN